MNIANVFSRHDFRPLMKLPLVLSGLVFLAATLCGATPPPFRVVDLDRGETQRVELSDGSTARVTLIATDATRDPVRGAVRAARATIEIDGERVELASGNYSLPLTIGRTQVDCPIIRAYVSDSSRNAWRLEKDARLRLWPAGSPWLQPGTFAYPVRQRWFASGTQYSNEPTFVDGGDDPGNKTVYYHNDLDFGGCEGLVDVVAASEGQVVSAGKEMLPGHTDGVVRPRYDVVYVRDGRGWYYRYSHLYSIDPAIRPGANVALGQKIGVLGKEGSSGGWAHLHFGVTSRQPSGKWGTVDAYAFIWEAYQRQYAPAILAVARPHHLVRAGDRVTLDGTRSWSAAGGLRHQWTFTDGSTARGPKVERVYPQPGHFSEILEVRDESGAVGYDFAVVQVVDPAAADRLPPSIQAAYAPSLGVKAGEPVTFHVRSFRTSGGGEEWDFGDGTPKVAVTSDGGSPPLAKEGFAVTQHRFAKPGDYVVRVEHRNDRGEPAIAHLYVQVEP